MMVRLGTRRSALATTQSESVAQLLRDRGHEVELVMITTEGDTNRGPLETMGGTGVFAAAIRHALLAGEVDLAVHSLKDLPVQPEPGLVLAAIPSREDPRDAIVARDGLTLAELPQDAVVGTGSPRRAAQLNALGLGLAVRGIRGNIDTRMSLVTSGTVDAVVLARAGLARIGRTAAITEVLDPLQMLPAPGQGALALEVREDATELRAALAPLDDPDTRAAVTAERALLGALEAGCSSPIGALAEVVEELDGSLTISLRAFVGSKDGGFELRRSVTGPIEAAPRLGIELAQLLLQDGAADVIPPGAPPKPDAFPTHPEDLVPTNAAERES
ncbi:hydroxymethylbilane synthase [Allobranchiibius sp. GilTou38]|uniref:hydroxymethylbilane synthase n=1 Tax=Allobranchiibius sp. GilTou38 TaxID=2815210 RepID=UPI001AA12642|nr:hydroxymethylbilane synthase [Allobranchiibius sp. GilTou38]MBO1766031.1 hydroxymethylbilane synthase [Allobranchiibius sp. GilTou38]